VYINTNNEIIQDTDAYNSLEGTKYPANWNKDAIPELTKITETPQPVDPALVVTGYIIDSTHTQVWQTRTKTAAEISSALKLAAYEALQGSDLVAIRCIKAGVVFPLEWQTYVADLRAVINGTLAILPSRPAYPVGT